MNQDPLVSVILPCYNGEKYLGIAIQSLLGQTYRNLEILVINDASTDNSVAIAEGFGDNRIKLLHNEKNLRIVSTMNKGIRHANGAFIARMDADDICLPTRIEKQVRFLQDNPGVSMIDTVMEYIDDEGNSVHRFNSDKVTEEEIRHTLPYTNCLGHSSVMLRREVYLKYPYREIVFEDYDLWLRLLNDGHRICKIAEPLLLYRLHQGSIMAKASAKRRLSLGRTKLFYYRRLPAKDMLKTMNQIVLADALYNYVYGGVKMALSNFRQ
jgi:glycosyltransferase involved in cell wall biosynthesis